MIRAMPEDVSSAKIEIRALTELADFDECVALQDVVWGYDASDRMTQKVYLLASRIGGQVLGAYAGERLAAFAMSLPGVRAGRSYLHSHQLAVLPEFRNRGIGRALKLAQRDDALRRGIELMEWTFDPLEIRNAHLNIARLGAIARRYARNFYGASSSPLQGGLPTDRLIAEWWLNSPHVLTTLRGDAVAFEAMRQVDVPGEIHTWKASDEARPKAVAAQAKIADELESDFAQGLAIVGYECSARDDGRFLLGAWNEGTQ